MVAPAQDGSQGLEVAVVGAGPFGLSVAATLGYHGVRATVFGPAMATWRNHMPPALELRSAWDETSLWAGDGRGTITAWSEAAGVPRQEPLRIETFLHYCEWFRGRFVAEHVEADVVTVERVAGAFRVTTSDGGSVEAQQVVVAVGALPFVYAPPPFAPWLGERVRFSTELRAISIDPSDTVAVIGGGQAAVEAAMQAGRTGARVELLTRTPLHWFADREPWQPRGQLEQRLYRLAYPALGYGPPPLNRLVLHPDLFAMLPRAVRERLAARVLRPGASTADREAFEAVARTSEGARVETVRRDDNALELGLSDGTARTASFVVLATGYRFQLERLGWLAHDILRDIRLEGSWPRLDRGFQTSVAGLRFVGYAAEGRYGPLSRFVLGTRFTADRVADAIARQTTAAMGQDR